MIEKVAEAAHEAGDDILFEKFVAGRDADRGRDQGGHPQGHHRDEAVPGHLRVGLQEQGRPAHAGRVVDYLPSPLDIPPTVANDPKTRRAGAARAQGRRALLRPRLQDHDRPVRRPARLPPRLLRQHEDRRHRPELHQGHEASASAASSRCTRTSARRSRRSTPATSRPRWASRTSPPATPSATPNKPVVLESINFPAPVIALAVEPKTKTDQEKLGTGLAQAHAGRPDLQGRDRQGHRPDQDLGHGRAAPRDHRGPPEARVRRRGQRGQAPGRLQGDDPQGGQGRGQVHQADRRQGPVRPLQDRARARSRRGLRLRERHHGRLDPQGVHQAHRGRASARPWTAASSPATRWWT